MKTTTATTQPIYLPKTLLDFWRTKKMAEQKITEAAVLSLFRDEKITVSGGAKLLGIPIQDFMDLLNAHGLTLWDDTKEEVEEDMRALRALRKKYGLPKKKVKKAAKKL